jgi:hypothetical protein
VNLLPFHSETLVSALPKKEVLGQLTRVTREVNFLDARTMVDPRIQFNGMVGQDEFRISKTLKRGDTFLPLITGNVESTPRGSIIFVKYRLFPSTGFFLGFWTVVLLGFAGYYFFAMQNVSYGIICLGLAVINYAMSLFFFNRQVKASMDIFHELINLEMKGKE